MSQYQVPPAGGWPEPDGRYPVAPQPAQESGPTMPIEAVEALPTEFNHLFRDSTPGDRRSIDRGPNRIGGAQAGFASNRPDVPGFPPQNNYSAAPQPSAQAAPDLRQSAPAPVYPQPQQYPAGQSVLDTQPVPVQYAPATPIYPVAAQYPPPDPAAQNLSPYPPSLDQQPQYGAFPAAAVAGNGTGGPAAPTGIRRSHLLIGGAAVAVVAAIAVIASLPGGSPKPKAARSKPPVAAAVTPLSPAQEAGEIYALVQQSQQLRSDANDGVIAVVGCTNLSAAKTLLQSTAAQRALQATEVAKIDVAGLSGGPQLVQTLQQAWAASATYDSDFATIAADVAHKCSAAKVKADPQYAAANGAGATADRRKALAAQLWNSNAVTSALAQISANSL